MPKSVVSFDFDDTLCMTDGTPNQFMIDLTREYSAQGFKVYIVTARHRTHESKAWIAQFQPSRIRVKDFVKEHNIPIKQCHFTNGELKGHLLADLKCCIHFDDSIDELNSAMRYGIKAIDSKGISLPI